ncbi:putative Ecp2 effector protein domain-containing protein [Seiridium unicorne]|uniref:Ecp2 effector protein domain-containing protein n=1 Tax=Seiridium unicorne TaxID=138068 RepID=A0ABR2USF6_9PEZI
MLSRIGISEAVVRHVQSALKGHYLAGEDRIECGVDTYQNKWKFYIKNTGNRDASLSQHDIWNYLQMEAKACQYGGDSAHSLWPAI